LSRQTLEQLILTMFAWTDDRERVTSFDWPLLASCWRSDRFGGTKLLLD